MSTLISTVLNSVADEDNIPLAGAISAAAILTTAAVYYTLSSKDKEHGFPKLRGIQLYHAWNFFQRRHDFLQSNFERNIGKSFSFNVLHHNVIALSGEDARQVFFSHSGLGPYEGRKIILGTAPQISDVDITTEEGEEINETIFNKKLNKILNKAQTRDVFPKLVRDVANRADKWGNDGKNGRIDPFIEVYDLVFLMTAHMTTCHDLVENEADLRRIGEVFTTFQAAATPASLLFPWFPSPARKIRKQASTELYTILHTYVETRRHAEPTNDAIDIFITDGETTQDIVEFIMTIIFAGVFSTGIISCWMLIHLAIHPEWREKCKGEIQGFLSHHFNESLSSATLREKLGAIPVSAWEDELPILDACVRESQRIVLSTVALRRNVREDINIGGQVVKRGDFVVYSVTEVNLNSEYYPEPHKWDPGRWLRPDPVPNTVYPFLGWGAGRHPCSGMKVAKLEMKLIMALFLAGYEFDLVDKDGKFPDPLPVSIMNGVRQSRPLGTYYFNFEKVVQ